MIKFLVNIYQPVHTSVVLFFFQQAKELGKADEDRLLKTRKLVLLVDLDQTLIHTTNDNIPPNLKVWTQKRFLNKNACY